MKMNIDKTYQTFVKEIKQRITSVQNLWNMRKFYLAYCENEKLQPLAGEISWTNNVVIFSRCKDPPQQPCYMRITKKFGWTKAVLTHQIEKLNDLEEEKENS